MAKTSRHFRLDDDVYAAAQDRARREYTNVTAVVEQHLAAYGGLRRSDEDEAPAKRSEPRRPVVGYSKERQARGKR